MNGLDLPELEQVADYLVRDLTNTDASFDEMYADAVGDIDALTTDDLRRLALVLALRLANAQNAMAGAGNPRKGGQ